MSVVSVPKAAPTKRATKSAPKAPAKEPSKEGVPKRPSRTKGPKAVTATKPAKASKSAPVAAKPVKAAKIAEKSLRSVGRPAGSVKRVIKGLEVHKTFQFDRPDAKVVIGGLRRIIVEAGPDGSKQLEKLAKMVTNNDKKLRDLLGLA